MSTFEREFGARAAARAPRTPPPEVDEQDRAASEEDADGGRDRGVVSLLQSLTMQVAQMQQAQNQVASQHQAELRQLLARVGDIAHAQEELSQGFVDLAEDVDERFRVLEVSVAQTQQQSRVQDTGFGQPSRVSFSAAGPTTSLPSSPQRPQPGRRATMYAANGGRLLPSPIQEDAGDPHTHTPYQSPVARVPSGSMMRGMMRGRGGRGGGTPVSIARGATRSDISGFGGGVGGVMAAAAGGATAAPSVNRDRGKSWFPVDSVPTFQGEYRVGSKDPRYNPLEWTRQVRVTMTARHIELELWVQECVTCMASKVLDRFRLAFGGDPNGALALRLLPTVSATPDPIFEVSWNEFCFWLVQEYITPSHQGQLEQLIAAEKCSGLPDVDEFCDRFMEHCIYSDFLRQYTASQIDESQLAAVLAVTDTPERQRHLREALPSVVQAALTDEETRNQARQASWAFSLSELIIFARASATAQLSAARRRGPPVSLNHTLIAPAPPPTASDAVLHALMASVETLKAQDHYMESSQQDQDFDLYLKISDFVDSPPTKELIDERLAAGLCIACGDAAHHWRRCAKLREGTPGLGERIDAAEAAELAQKRQRSRARTFPRRTPSARASGKAELQLMEDPALAPVAAASSSEMVPYHASYHAPAGYP